MNESKEELLSERKNILEKKSEAPTDFYSQQALDIIQHLILSPFAGSNESDASKSSISFKYDSGKIYILKNGNTLKKPPSSINETAEPLDLLTLLRAADLPNIVLSQKMLELAEKQFEKFKMPNVVKFLKNKPHEKLNKVESACISAYAVLDYTVINQFLRGEIVKVFGQGSTQEMNGEINKKLPGLILECVFLAMGQKKLQAENTQKRRYVVRAVPDRKAEYVTQHLKADVNQGTVEYAMTSTSEISENVSLDQRTDPLKNEQFLMAALASVNPAHDKGENGATFIIDCPETESCASLSENKGENEVLLGPGKFKTQSIREYNGRLFVLLKWEPLSFEDGCTLTSERRQDIPEYIRNWEQYSLKNFFHFANRTRFIEETEPKRSRNYLNLDGSRSDNTNHDITHVVRQSYSAKRVCKFFSENADNVYEYRKLLGNPKKMQLLQIAAGCWALGRDGEEDGNDSEIDKARYLFYKKRARAIFLQYCMLNNIPAEEAIPFALAINSDLEDAVWPTDPNKEPIKKSLEQFLMDFNITDPDVLRANNDSSQYMHAKDKIPPEKFHAIYKDYVNKFKTTAPNVGVDAIRRVCDNAHWLDNMRFSVHHSDKNFPGQPPGTGLLHNIAKDMGNGKPFSPKAKVQLDKLIVDHFLTLTGMGIHSHIKRDDMGYAYKHYITTCLPKSECSPERFRDPEHGIDACLELGLLIETGHYKNELDLFKENKHKSDTTLTSEDFLFIHREAQNAIYDFLEIKSINPTSISDEETLLKILPKVSDNVSNYEHFLADEKTRKEIVNCLAMAIINRKEFGHHVFNRFSNTKKQLYVDLLKKIAKSNFFLDENFCNGLENLFNPSEEWKKNQEQNVKEFHSTYAKFSKKIEASLSFLGISDKPHGDDDPPPVPFGEPVSEIDLQMADKVSTNNAISALILKAKTDFAKSMYEAILPITYVFKYTDHEITDVKQFFKLFRAEFIKAKFTYVESIKNIAQPYAGSEDLKDFIETEANSEPNDIRKLFGLFAKINDPQYGQDFKNLCLSHHIYLKSRFQQLQSNTEEAKKIADGAQLLKHAVDQAHSASQHLEEAKKYAAQANDLREACSPMVRGGLEVPLPPEGVNPSSFLEEQRKKVQIALTPTLPDLQRSLRMSVIDVARTQSYARDHLPSDLGKLHLSLILLINGRSEIFYRENCKPKKLVKTWNIIKNLGKALTCIENSEGRLNQEQQEQLCALFTEIRENLHKRKISSPFTKKNYISSASQGAALKVLKDYIKAHQRREMVKVHV